MDVRCIHSLGMAALLAALGAGCRATSTRTTPAATPVTSAQDLDFEAAIFAGDTARVRSLMAAGARPDARLPLPGCGMGGGGGGAILPAIVIAARQGRTEIVRVLLEQGANPNVRSPYGETALSAAAMGGDFAAMRLLLRHGASVRARDDHGRPSLHWAALEGQPGSVRLLLEHGADPSVRDRGGSDVPSLARAALAWTSARDLPRYRRVLEILREFRERRRGTA